MPFCEICAKDFEFVYGQTLYKECTRTEKLDCRFEDVIHQMSNLLYFPETYLKNKKKWRPLSHWLLCCHPKTQPPRWAPPPLMAHVAAWVQTCPIFFSHKFSILSLFEDVLDCALSPWPFKHCNRTFSRHPFHLKNTKEEEGIVGWGQSETTISEEGES